jgi:hypothetical protein
MRNIAQFFEKTSCVGQVNLAAEEVLCKVYLKGLYSD